MAKFVTGVSGNKRGPKPRVLTTHELQMISARLAAGHKQKDLPRLLSMSPATFSAYAKTHAEVEVAIDAGISANHMTLLDEAVKIARNVNHRDQATMIRFLLEARHGYRTRDEVNIDSTPRITINIPGAVASLEQWVNLQQPPVVDGPPSGEKALPAANPAGQHLAPSGGGRRDMVGKEFHRSFEDAISKFK